MNYEMAVLDGLVRQAHFSVAPDLSFNPGEASLESHVAELHTLPNRHTSYRTEVYQRLVEKYGADNQLCLYYQIFMRLAPHLDAIFVSQIEQTALMKSGSWVQYAPQETVKLHEEIYHLLGRVKSRDAHNQTLSRFLENDPVTTAILAEVADELISASGRGKLKTVQMKLELLASEASENGRPVFLFCQSEFYTHQNEPISHAGPELLESDLRLIIPFTGEEATRRSSIRQLLWQRIVANYRYIYKNVRIPIFSPQTIEGIGIGFAGSEIFSYGAAEATSWGYHLTHNLIQYEEEIDRIYHLVGKPVPRNYFDYVWLIFSAHEMGHPFNLLEAPDLGETATDLSTFFMIIDLLRENNSQIEVLDQMNLRDFVIIFISLYAPAAQDGVTGMGINDGYAKSARVMVDQIVKSGIITSSPNSYRLAVASGKELTSRARRLSVALRALHRNLFHEDPQALEYISDMKHQFRHGSEAQHLLSLVTSPDEINSKGI